MNTLTEAQEMWMDTIISVVSQPKFNIKIGDMNYVLGNMIAKYVSSSKHYRISNEALSYIKSISLDETKPLHIKKHIYGKDKNTILEHIIPSSIIKNAIVNSRNDPVTIQQILLHSGYVIIVTREEDKRLTEGKLSRKMPDSWSGFGDVPEKRYDAVGIQISSVFIEHEGPICR